MEQILERLLASQRRMMATMKAHHEEMMAKMNAWL
jgi:hypothetical protein